MLITFLNLPIILGLIGTCALLRIKLRSWLVPPAFFAFYWTIFILINRAFPEYPLRPAGLLYVFAVFWACAAGHVFGTRGTFRFRNWPASSHPAPLSAGLFRVILFVQVAAGLIYVAILIRFGVRQIENIPWIAQLFLIAHFSAPITIGVLLGAGLLRPVDRWLSGLALLPALTISILYTGRTAFIGPAVVMASSYLMGSVMRSPRAPALFSWRRIVLAGAAFGFFVAFATGIYVLRIARGPGKAFDFSHLNQVASGTAALKESYHSVRTSIFGQPSAFTAMFIEHYDQPSFQPYWGKFMFAGPLTLAGYERPAHADYFGPDNVETNVYTVFAPPLEDFGIAGSLLWWVAYGLASAVFWRLARGGSFTAAMALTILLINLQIGSCFLFRYNSVIGAYIVSLFFGAVIDSFRRARRLQAGSSCQAS